MTFIFFQDLLRTLLGIICSLMLIGILIVLVLSIIIIVTMMIIDFVHLIKDTYRKGKH